MSTECRLFLDGDEALVDQAAEAAMAEVFRLEATYSRYREDSLISSINRVAQAGGEFPRTSKPLGS